MDKANIRARSQVEALEPRRLFSVFSVTNIADSGAGSLRQAILMSNGTPGANQINFNIAGAGFHTIFPLTALPTITNPVFINGPSQPGYAGAPLVQVSGDQAGTGANGFTISSGSSSIQGLTINGFNGAGIELLTNGSNVIAGNFIGVNPTATAPHANTGAGILIFNSGTNTIGGISATARNIISGNLNSGIRIAGATSTSNYMLSNFIGSDVSGVNPIGNALYGILIRDGNGNIVGSADSPNKVLFNGKAGVAVINLSQHNAILFNSIYGNQGLGIDLTGDGVTANHPGGGARAGENALQNYPVLTYASSANNATAVGGSLNAAPNTTYRLQFFSTAIDPSGHGQGRRFIGNFKVATNNSGNVNFILPLPHPSTPGVALTATATDPQGDTSEFSNDVSIASAVYPTADDQYMVELTNRARANPNAEAAADGISLNEGPPSTPLDGSPKQPLAINPFLVNSAHNHTQAMITAQQFAHQVSGEPLTFDQRESAAGYVFSGSFGAGENIAERGTTPTVPNPDTTTLQEHNDLFIDTSEPGRGHRVNILDNQFKEMGVGIQSGVFQSFNSVLSTEDFAFTAGDSFLTGVAYNDINHDNFYNPGEGLGGVIIAAVDVVHGTRFITSTWASGGYSLQLPNGTYNITASGGALGGFVHHNNLTISGLNVKLDYTPSQATPSASRQAVAATSGLPGLFSASLMDDSSKKIGHVLQSILDG